MSNRTDDDSYLESILQQVVPLDPVITSKPREERNNKHHVEEKVLERNKRINKEREKEKETDKKPEVNLKKLERDNEKKSSREKERVLKPLSSRVTSITSLKKRQRPIRYFVMKCISFSNLEIALQNHIWATQAHNEAKLNQAYSTSEVVLVFSVNNSRHFQAYGRMASRIGSKSSSIWHHNQNILGGLFHIEWMCVRDLPFHESDHLHNPLNENKPVKISRDGQEIPEEVGYELCRLIDKAKESEFSHYISTNDKPKSVSSSNSKKRSREKDDLKDGHKEIHSKDRDRHSISENMDFNHTNHKDHFSKSTHLEKLRTSDRERMNKASYYVTNHGDTHRNSRDSSSRSKSTSYRTRDDPYPLSPHHRRNQHAIVSHHNSSSSQSLTYRPRSEYGPNKWSNELSEVDYMNYLMWFKQMGAYSNNLSSTYYKQSSSTYDKRRR